MAMILLKPGNRSLGETVADLIEWKPNENSDEKQTRRPCTIKLWDFDSTSFSVRVDEDDTDHMFVSMHVPFLDDVIDHGAGDALNEIYGDLVQSDTESGYNVTLKIAFDDFTTEDSQQKLIEKLEMLKPNVVGGVFDHFFKGLADKKSQEPFTFDIRPDTQVYFVPKKDKCTVIFGIDFKENVDKCIAKIFMQEFADAKRRIGAAPQCTFSVTPQRELRNFDITEATGNLGFITFGIMSSHVNSAAKRAKLSANLQSFRTYLQYHIKCSKSYFHSRMRLRVVELLKVLNRAKVKAPGAKNAAAGEKDVSAKKKKSRRNF